MILDTFKIDNATTQLDYDEAFEVWDRAGSIVRALLGIWPGLGLVEGKPNQQVLKGPNVSISTGLKQSSVTITGVKALDQQKIQQVKDTFEVWRRELSLRVLKRVSTRAIYLKEVPTIEAANKELLELRLVRWPTTKVFDQPLVSEKNSVDVCYRFEDAESFALLRFKAERVKFEATLDAQWFDEPVISKEKTRIIIDFDKGQLGSVNAEKFRMDDWLKGVQHVLRRDIEKVTKEAV